MELNPGLCQRYHWQSDTLNRLAWLDFIVSSKQIPHYIRCLSLSQQMRFYLFRFLYYKAISGLPDLRLGYW
jgi:hypothetical protein